MLWRFLCASTSVAAALQTLPPIEWINANSTTYGRGLAPADLPTTIYIQRDFANVTDKNGLTLIPPTAYEFADTFRQDLAQVFGGDWKLKIVDSSPSKGIFLRAFPSNASVPTYANGEPTEEAYELEISNGLATIGGSGARGMFWGTRTLLQKLSIANGSPISPGRVVDSPAYATRGYMLDAGRKWYTAGFLKELCTYASFFKMSEFHYHSSDNYPLNRGHNETWNEVFSHFSLNPENNTELRGLIQRPNETLSRADFEDFQKHCAQRGVTVIPEIEAPGHCLAVTKWKPELALPKKDLLNLTHPDAIPTIKSIWAEFLPWFQTKEVHIGADEYDSKLADDYINFVNTMSDFVKSTSGKRIRIWGTNEPSDNLTINKDIIIQHWQYGESDPIQLQKDNYTLINSNDWWAYMSLKNDHTPILPLPYPQFYNVTRTMNFANVDGWQWDPSVFNPVNTSSQLEPGAKVNKGAILAAWSDNGPDATTQLEAYYAMREGIPVVAARAWSGARGTNISVKDLDATLKYLTPLAPGQNLERRIPNSQRPSKDTPLFTWTRPTSSQADVVLGKGSYGPPYTLTLNVTSSFTLSGPDTSLTVEPISTNLTAWANSTLVFSTSDNFPYPLRSTALEDGYDPGHPGRIWVNETSSSHEEVPITLPASIRIETDVVNGSRVWVDDEYKGRFEVFVFGGRNTQFSWSQMALVAPLQAVKGGVETIVLEGGTGGRGDNVTDPSQKPAEVSAGSQGAASMAALTVALLATVLLGGI